ncbi:DUF2537 domain-containing protein [Nakamurella deserti]|uniref:DUF2537 domain-containing protein n=1 Tax=Nakamurella deserti TaxID=2164074 RepID=UPI00197BC078|nr:DUF2537 domain-containing protein [Nakamurella deserti]
MVEESGLSGAVWARPHNVPDRVREVAETSAAPAPGVPVDPPGLTGVVPMLPLTDPPRRRFGRGSRAPSGDQTDWRWVEEWRRGNEPTPWGPGLFLAGFAGLIIGCAVYVITAGLADNVVFALAANIVVALGLTPALWMSRALPVLRWIALGGALGTVVAWISLLFFPLVP